MLFLKKKCKNLSKQVDILTFKSQALQIVYNVAIIFISSVIILYCILLIIDGEKLLLFHIFTFIPKKRLQLPAFTSFHSINVQKFAKTFGVAKQSAKNAKVFHGK